MKYDVKVSIFIEADNAGMAMRQTRELIAETPKLLGDAAKRHENGYFEVISAKPFESPLQRLGDVKPGTVFVIEKELTFGTHTCLKLADQRVVNLDTQALFKSVDQNQMVKVLVNQKLSLTEK